MPTSIPTGALTVTLTEALTDLTHAYTVSGGSPHTTSLFTLYVGKMIEFVAQDGVVNVDQVRTADVTAFLAHEQARGMKPASLSVTLRTLRRFFQWCVELTGHHIRAKTARRPSR